jgi:DNA-binding LacI/PurR family transcriptional regulator
MRQTVGGSVEEAAEAGPRRITVFSPQVGGFWTGDVIAGIEVACVRRNIRPVLIQTDTGWQTPDSHRALRELVRLGGGPDLGIIAIAADIPDADLALISECDSPLVTIAGPNPRPGWPSVTIDNVGGAADAVRHLLSHGHTRIGFAGALSVPDIAERYRGYREAMVEAGVEPEATWLFSVEDRLEKGGRAAAAAVLEAGVPITAILAATDLHALELMAGLRDAGVKVPYGVAVIGFDDSQIAQTARPALSSVRQMPSALGVASVDLLAAAAGGPPGAQADVALPTTLIQRHSCGCLAPQPGLAGTSEDWNAPNWQRRLKDVLESTLTASAEIPTGPGSDAWPGVKSIIRALDTAVRGLPESRVDELDDAWAAACDRTRNAETLLSIVDLLEQVGLYRQWHSSGGFEPVRPRLARFVAHARLQVLRGAAIADPLHHPRGPVMILDMARAFMSAGPGNRGILAWMDMIDASFGCLALWEPSRGRQLLRICDAYGSARDDGILGRAIAPRDFPLDPEGWGRDARGLSTLMIVRVATPERDWGILVVDMPMERPPDRYWNLQHGASLVALTLQQRAAR